MWKEGGKYYMRCTYCPSVRHPTPTDWKQHIDRNKERLRSESLSPDQLLELIRNYQEP